METLGAMCSEALNLVRDLGAAAAAITEKSRCMAFTATQHSVHEEKRFGSTIHATNGAHGLESQPESGFIY